MSAGGEDLEEPVREQVRGYLRDVVPDAAQLDGGHFLRGGAGNAA